MIRRCMGVGRSPLGFLCSQRVGIAGQSGRRPFLQSGLTGRSQGGFLTPTGWWCDPTAANFASASIKMARGCRARPHQVRGHGGVGPRMTDGTAESSGLQYTENYSGNRLAGLRSRSGTRSARGYHGGGDDLARRAGARAHSCGPLPWQLPLRAGRRAHRLPLCIALATRARGVWQDEAAEVAGPGRHGRGFESPRAS